MAVHNQIYPVYKLSLDNVDILIDIFHRKSHDSTLIIYYKESSEKLKKILTEYINDELNDAGRLFCIERILDNPNNDFRKTIKFRSSFYKIRFVDLIINNCKISLYDRQYNEIINKNYLITNDISPAVQFNCLIEQTFCNYLMNDPLCIRTYDRKHIYIIFFKQELIG